MSRIKKKQSEEISLIKNWIEQLSESEFRDAITVAFEKDANGKSHEYELLKQMVDLQSPPPTPIHPRAIGVKLASNVFSSDGRDEEERIMKNRRIRPRLYQFIERKTSNGFDLDQSLASLPPEIAAMVRKENTVQTSSKQKRNRGENALSYDVIARQFKASWGEQLSLAPTEEMKMIDEELLFGTYLKGGGEQSRSCTFKRCNYIDFEHQDEKAHFLKVLKIASRGRFLSEEPQRKSCKFMAPWLQPTKEWFSLSTYLASRFEIALWNSYRFHRCNGFVKTVAEDSIEASLRQLNVSQISSAVAGVMKQLLEVSIADGKLRDELVFKLLTRRPDVRSTRDLEEIQLVRLNTTIDTFRILLMNHLKCEITKVAERDLLNSHPNQGVVGNSGTTKVKGKKRRKKKKRRSKPLEIKLVAIDEKRGDDANSTSNSSRSSNHVGLTLPHPIFLNEGDNQHKIVALGILDDIMEGVWKEVGLHEKVQEDDGFQPTRMKANAQKRQKEAYILKKRIIKKKPEVLQKAENLPNSSEFIEENMMTMKRSNLSPSLSIWTSNSRPPLFQASGGSKGLTNLFTPLETIDDRVESNFLTSNQGDQSGFLHGGSYEYGDQNFSFFSDFFDNGKVDTDFASSTAASIASSILDNDEEEEVMPMEDDFFFRVPTPTEAVDAKLWPEADIVEVKEQEVETEIEVNVQETPGSEYDPDDSKLVPSMSDFEDDAREVKNPPVVVSLADLGELRRKKSSRQTFSDIEEETIDEGNEMPPENLSLPKRFSREDLRSIDVPPRRKNVFCSSRTVDFSSLTYRNVAVKKSDKARSVSSHDVPHHYSKRPSLRRIKSFTRDMKEVIIDRGNFNLNACARSETALDDNEESSHWNVIPKNVVENDNNSVTKDGATTISSIPTYHEIDEIHNLQSERDSYRDICLTMAAEISKLKNMLALERINSNYSIPQNVDPFGIEYMSMPSFVHERTEQGATKRYVAMSDAGLNEVPVSEDGNLTETATVDVEKKRLQRANSFGVHHNFISGGSDIVSLGNTTYSAAIPPQAIYPHKLAEKDHFNGLQSRLSDEANVFLTKTAMTLKRLESKRVVAIQRLSRLITAIWPRAQLVSYGSQETNLRLPRSDLDFVICLPEVHKTTPAQIPGDLEGRNAINESNQKLLARKLKSESWIDPRSIKVIERTLIPVIKFTTKDTRSKSLQLDVSFDSRKHHGIESVVLVKQTIEAFPMIQPMVLILKQFLLDRGLLTAYTGGLSSHSLFLMITRYLQEQSFASYVDLGGLLMGFLDFYGNVFDPRIIGISILNGGQYFRRPNYQTGRPDTFHFSEPSLTRRNSFQDQNERTAGPSSFGLDPLYVEDPISRGNNVGRNSFRINQVQRAFSDAHRALVASLEWEIDVGQDEVKFPLLKSLFPSSYNLYND